MKPLEFWWTEDQQVTVTNPTSDNFEFMVHGKKYMLGAGKTAKMPGYIAWMYVYNQAINAAQAEGKFERWNDDDFRLPYFERFVVGVDDLITTIDEEPEPEVHTFGSVEEAQEANPEPGTGVNYTPNRGKKRGRPSRV